MADLQYQGGLLVTVQFSLQNVPENASTAMVLSVAGNSSFIVPPGVTAYPYFLCGMSNADLTAGTLTFKVSSSGSAITGGPEPALSDTVQRAGAFVQPNAVGIAAGGLIGVLAVAAAAFAPNTADADAILAIVLVPDP